MKKRRRDEPGSGTGWSRDSGQDAKITIGQEGSSVSLKNRRWIVWAAIGAVVLAACVLMILSIFRGLPDEETIKRYRPSSSSEIRDCRNTLIFSVGQDRIRLWIALSSMAPSLVKAVVTSEDDTFFEHTGIRVEAIRKAFWKDFKAGRWIQGASTITQQLARNAFLHKRKTIRRKLQEVIVARRIEKVLTKKRILELYLNVVEWGEGVFGAEAAARTCFGKPASGLSLAESAMLAGMLPNPKYRNPFVRIEKVKEKQVRVLDLMKNNRVISEDEYCTALSEPIILRQGRSPLILGETHEGAGDRCPIRMLRQYLDERFGPDALLLKRSVVRLTLDLEIQRQLERILPAGEEDSVLVIREGQAVRAFQCIGGPQRPKMDALLQIQADVMTAIDDMETLSPMFSDSSARNGRRSMHDWQWVTLSKDEWKRLDLID